MSFYQNTSVADLDLVCKLRHVDMKQLNSHIEMFKKGGSNDNLVYLVCCKLIGRYFNYPESYNGHFLYSMLYNTSSLTAEEKQRFKSLKIVQTMGQIAKELLKYSCYELAADMMGVDYTNQLVETLQRMDQIYNSSNVVKSQTGIVRKVGSPFFFQEEDHWLHCQLKKFDDVFNTVTPGPVVVGQLVDIASGNFSVFPDFGVNMGKISVTRFERVQVTHPEFDSMSCKDRYKIVMKNSHLIRMMYLSHQETRSSFQEQIDFESLDVEGDATSVMKKASPVVLSDLLPMPLESRQNLKRLSWQVNLKAVDDTIFKLVVLVLLTDSPDQYREVKNLQQTYLSILHKKLAKANGMDLEFYEDTGNNLANLMSDLKAMRDVFVKFDPWKDVV